MMMRRRRTAFGSCSGRRGRSPAPSQARGVCRIRQHLETHLLLLLVTENLLDAGPLLARNALL
eukprot:2288489-Pyramimonas_sp.AAC.1